jgi:hypothetical protein
MPKKLWGLFLTCKDYVVFFVLFLVIFITLCQRAMNKTEDSFSSSEKYSYISTRALLLLQAICDAMVLIIALGRQDWGMGGARGEGGISK